MKVIPTPSFIRKMQLHCRHILWIVLLMSINLMSFLGCAPAPDNQGDRKPQDFAVARKRMVAEQLERPGRDIKHSGVLAAMGEVPRHEFVPEHLRKEAYNDHPLPIGHNQTISQPYIVAFMTEQLNPKPSDVVLEIGTGSGYQAAVLSKLVKAVYSIEIVEPLGKQASQTLARLGYTNVHVKIGDGYLGWPEMAPFDAIIVTCAPEKIPPALVSQLKEGGRMSIPVGPNYDQALYLLRKENGEIKQQNVLGVRFVPMTGKANTEL